MFSLLMLLLCVTVWLDLVVFWVCGFDCFAFIAFGVVVYGFVVYLGSDLVVICLCLVCCKGCL